MNAGLSSAHADDQSADDLGAPLVAGDPGVRRIWLLTTTAAGYVPRFGFLRCDRAAAPPPVPVTAESSRPCPESAVCLILDTRSA